MTLMKAARAQVFAWGCNSSGRLGVGNTENSCLT